MAWTPRGQHEPGPEQGSGFTPMGRGCRGAGCGGPRRLEGAGAGLSPRLGEAGLEAGTQTQSLVRPEVVRDAPLA